MPAQPAALTNDALTLRLATTTAHAAVVSSKDATLPAALAFFSTQAHALTSARHEFGHTLRPFAGGFNSELAAATIAQIFAAAA